MPCLLHETVVRFDTVEVASAILASRSAAAGREFAPARPADLQAFNFMFPDPTPTSASSWTMTSRSRHSRRRCRIFSPPISPRWRATSCVAVPLSVGLLCQPGNAAP